MLRPSSSLYHCEERRTMWKRITQNRNKKRDSSCSELLEKYRHIHKVHHIINEMFQPHGSLCQWEGHAHARARWKVLSLNETQDKQPLGTDLDRSWCHCHTMSMIKLFLVTAHSSLDIDGSIGTRLKVVICCRRCPWSHGLQPIKLYTCVTVIPAPVRVLTQWPLVPSFTLVVS